MRIEHIARAAHEKGRRKRYIVTDYPAIDQIYKEIRDIGVEKVCEDTGLSVSTVDNWIHGRAFPGILTFMMIADHFGYKVTLEKIFKK